MPNREKIFKRKSKIAFDETHRKIISFNMGKYNAAFRKGVQSLENVDELKDAASKIKDDTLNNLKHYLQEFEKNFTANGGKIIWAKDGKQAVDAVVDILQKSNSRLVVKSKSMITEEIDLNTNLEKKNIEVVETDLGEYIVQIAGEKPYHIVTPAMHKSKEDISELFNKKFGISKDTKPEELTEFVRNKLREKFVNADAGITGANFLLSDIGGFSLTENEGNAILTSSNTKVHIAIAGIEKLLPSVEHLSIFLPLLATHGTGQKITTYNSIHTGPIKNEDGSQRETYLVLLDNGRSNIYNLPEVRSSLKCIRCGACLNACPVYQNIGGYTYDSVYSGPIGSVITPHLKGEEKYGHLSFASSLCGKCNEVCPVKIDLKDLLLKNRHRIITNNKMSLAENQSVNLLTTVMLKRKRLNRTSYSFKSLSFKLFLGRDWGKKRKSLVFARKSFNTIHKKKFGLKSYSRD